MPTPAKQTGGTRGNALDASFEVKAQAVALFWKLHARGTGRMEAYRRTAELTNMSWQSVSAYVAEEDKAGIAALHPKEKAGRPTNFSPRKQSALEKLMEETDGSPTLRETSMALQEVGVGSGLDTATGYLEKGGYHRFVKRQRTLLTGDHMKARLDYCNSHFEDDFRDVAMSDEKLFVLGKRRNWGYAKGEDGDEPMYNFVMDKQHPPQVMVTAVVAQIDRPVLSPPALA